MTEATAIPIKPSVNCWKNLFRKLFTSDNYYKSMQPMFFVTFVSGVTPFRVVTKQNGSKSVETSFLGYFNCVLHGLLMGCCYAYTMRYNESVVGYFLSNNISNVGHKLYVLSSILSISVLFVSAIKRKNILIKSFNIFLEIDRRFNTLCYWLDYTRIMRFVLFVLQAVATFGCTITVICVYCLNSMSVYPSPCLILIVIGEVLSVSVVISLFCTFSKSSQRRITLLNRVSLKT